MFISITAADATGFTPLGTRLLRQRHAGTVFRLAFRVAGAAVTMGHAA